MPRGRIYWFHGQYYSAVTTGYGGGERTVHMLKLISEITGKTPVHVVLKRPLRRLEGFGAENARVLELEGYSKLGRLILKMIRLGERSGHKLRFLSASTRDMKKIINEISGEDLVVFDGVKGYLMARSSAETLRRRAGLTVYLSHNFEADYYMGARGWLMRVESEATARSDLVISASERDAVRYELDLNVPREKIVVFPNIYPVDFDKQEKFEEKTLIIVAGSGYREASILAKRLAKLRVAKIVYIGKGVQKMDGLLHRRFIEKREDYLSFISAGHVGLNCGLWLGGSSVKKFDYALASLAILSNGLGARGEFLPGEIVYSDFYDMVGKIRMTSVDELVELGRMNKEKVEKMYNQALSQFRRRLRVI